jgi:hypothetical protein
MKEENEDLFFKKIMPESKRQMPFPGFEDDVMMSVTEIESEISRLQEGYKRGVAYSWFFFAVGILCGVLLTLLIPQVDMSLIGIDSSLFLLVFQVGFILFVLLHFEKLMMMVRSGTQRDSV